MEVESFQELFQCFILLLQLDEELLRVATRLSAGARAHVLLHMLPLLAEQLERLKEPEMLVTCPSTSLGSTLFLKGFGLLDSVLLGVGALAKRGARDCRARRLRLRQAPWASVPLCFIGVVTLAC